MLARKAGPRTRTHAEMLELGAECIGSFAKHRFRLIRKLPRSNVTSAAQIPLIETWDAVPSSNKLKAEVL
jgi:hypothetical protein